MRKDDCNQPGAEPGRVMANQSGAEPGRMIANQSGAEPGRVIANQSGAEPGKVILAFLCAYIAAWGKKTDRKKTDIGQ